MALILRLARRSQSTVNGFTMSTTQPYRTWIAIAALSQRVPQEHGFTLCTSRNSRFVAEEWPLPPSDEGFLKSMGSSGTRLSAPLLHMSTCAANLH